MIFRDNCNMDLDTNSEGSSIRLWLHNSSRKETKVTIFTITFLCH